MKCIKIVILAAIIILNSMYITGCEKEEQYNSCEAKGEYVESKEKIELSENDFISRSIKNEWTCYYVDNLCDIIKNYDMGDTSKCISRTFMDYPITYQYIVSVVKKRNYLYLIYVSMDSELSCLKLYNNGETEDNKFTIGDQTVKVTLSNKVQIYVDSEENFNVLLDENEQVKVFDNKTGKLRYEYPDKCSYMDLVNNKLYVMVPEKQAINIYNTNTYSLEQCIQYPTEQGKQIIAVNSDDYSIFLVDQRGIRHHLYNGNLWEEIVQPDGTNLAISSYEILGAYVVGECYYVRFKSELGEQFMERYYYDKDYKQQQKEKISIFMCCDNELVRQAAARYQIQHQEASVDIQVVQEGKEEEMLKEINQEILEGKGPDIVLLDKLPVQKYIDKGLLMNINDIIKPKVEDEDWQEDVAGLYEKNGNYYAAAMRIRVPMIWGNKDIIENIDSIDELVEYKKKHPTTILLGKNLYELIEQTASISVPYFVDKDGNYSREKCERYLENLEILAEQKYHEANPMCTSIDCESQAKYREMIQTAYGDTSAFILEPCQLMNIAWAETAITNQTQGCVNGLEIDGEKIFEAKGILGITNSSKHKKAAIEILQNALGNQGEYLNSNLGLPNSQTALAFQERTNKDYYDIQSDYQGRKLEVENRLGVIYYNSIQEVKKAKLCVSDYKYSKIFDLISPYLRAYGKGEMPMDEALNKMDKVVLKNMEMEN